MVLSCLLVSLLRDMLAQVLVVVVDEAPVGGVVQAALHVLYLVVLTPFLQVIDSSRSW